MIDETLINEYLAASAAHQLAYLPDGRLLEAAADDSGRAMLRAWVRSDERAADRIVPAGSATLPKAVCGGAGVLHEADGTLTAFYSSSDGVATLTLAAAESETRFAEWIEPARSKIICRHDERVLSPTCVAGVPGGPMCVALLARAKSSDDPDGISLAVKQRSDEWIHHRMLDARGLLAPAACIGPSGSIALAWSDTRRMLHYLFTDCEALAETGPLASVTCGHRGTQPSLAPISETTWMLAAESEFSQIVTCIIDGNDCVHLPPIHNLDIRLKRDVLHGPQLHRDGDQRLWLVFTDATRHAVFGCQWLGDTWGDPLVLGAIVDHTPRLTRSLQAIKTMKSRANTVAGEIICLLHSGASEATPRTAAVPRRPRPPESPRTVLFLDMLEVAEMRGVERRFVEAEKDAGNPLFEPDPERPDECRRVFNTGRIMREEDGRFRMWYAAMGEPSSGPDWWNWLKVGYAESQDGLAWQRTNVADSASHLWSGMPYVPTVFMDPQDTALPYKWLAFDTYGQQLERAAGAASAQDAISGALWESPDGERWTRREARLSFDGPRPLSFVPQCVIVDECDPDPSQRYKAYGFSSLTLCRRGLSLATSGDLIQWRTYADNPVLNAELRGAPLIINGPESQVHDAVVWQYRGMFLALYQCQYGPDEHDLELAISRDGRRFDFVAPGHKLISRGDAGCWDRGSITAAVPLIVDNDIWIYYGGTDYHHPSDGPYSGYRSDRMKVACGLARLRLDGFAYLTVADPEQKGWVETVALNAPNTPCELTVNACIPDGCSIAAELLDVDEHRAIPGYGIDAAVPATGDSTAVPLQWRGQGGLPSGRPFRLRVHLRGSRGQPRLFAVRLVRRGT